MDLMDKEHYLNIIELLKKTLEFYADETNYSGAMGNAAMIEMDRGEQARFTLKSIQSLMKQTQEMGDSFDELLKNVSAFKEDDPKENPMDKLLKDIQKLKDGGN